MNIIAILFSCSWSWSQPTVHRTNRHRAKRKKKVDVSRNDDKFWIRNWWEFTQLLFVWVHDHQRKNLHIICCNISLPISLPLLRRHYLLLFVSSCSVIQLWSWSCFVERIFFSRKYPAHNTLPKTSTVWKYKHQWINLFHVFIVWIPYSFRWLTRILSPWCCSSTTCGRREKKSTKKEKQQRCFENQIMESEEREWVRKILDWAEQVLFDVGYMLISLIIWWCQLDAMNYYFKLLSDFAVCVLFLPRREEKRNSSRGAPQPFR